jgi:hypothetical protein
LPAKLEELLMGNEVLTIGPKSAEILQEFLDAAKPPMADRKQIEVMIAKLALATASQKRSVEMKKVLDRINEYFYKRASARELSRQQGD